MAVNTRLSAPNYKIFEPDALDAIYAKGTLDPLQGGISWALGNAHRMDSTVDQNRTLEELDKFNKMAANLDAMEIAQKQKEAALKIGGALIEKGEDPTNIIGSENIYNNPGGSLLPGLLRNKISAETAAALAKAAADKSAGQDTETVQKYDAGTDTVRTYTRKRPGTGGHLDTESAPSAPPTTSTPTVTSTPNAGAAQRQAVVKTGMAAVNAGPGQLAATQLPNGNYQFKNTATNVTKEVTPDGKVVR